jgi:hypothetical protein
MPKAKTIGEPDPRFINDERTVACCFGIKQVIVDETIIRAKHFQRFVKDDRILAMDSTNLHVGDISITAWYRCDESEN